jgi:limonene 1,2-monooxygenase
MRFGAFLGPFHAERNQNPTLALARDVEMAQLLDRLGYDEIWFGEHHSGGVETIASPELFCAYVANLTRHIRLGSGVISLPFHNPLWVADRAVLLDHLTRGRFMLGLGPGVLRSDAAMIGLEVSQLRALFDEDLPVVLHLLRSEEPISAKTDRYELHEASLHLRPYSDLDLAVTSMHSMAGPELAGRYGLGILQLSGLEREGLAVLGDHLRTFEAAAIAAGRSVDRSRVRVVGLMHLAETRDQAIKEVAFGLNSDFIYRQEVIGGAAAAGSTYESRLEWAVESGHALIGTPDDAIERLEELVELSGGIGAFLHWCHEWASPAATAHSYELFARRVMPALTGSHRSVEASRARAVELRLAAEAARR